MSFCQRKVGDKVVVELGADDSYSSDVFYEDHDVLPKIKARRKQIKSISRAAVSVGGMIVKRNSTVEYVKDNADEIFQ